MGGPVDWDALVIGPLQDIFGEAATYIPVGGAPLQVTGVFDEAYRPVAPLGASNGQEPVAIGEDGDTVSAGPVLGVQLSQFPPALAAVLADGGGQDDTVLILRTGQLFRVRETHADGHGWAKLLLNQTAA